MGIATSNIAYIHERTVKIFFYSKTGGARLQIFKKLGGGGPGPPGPYGRYAYAYIGFICV